MSRRTILGGFLAALCFVGLVARTDAVTYETNSVFVWSAISSNSGPIGAFITRTVTIDKHTGDSLRISATPDVYTAWGADDEIWMRVNNGAWMRLQYFSGNPPQVIYEITDIAAYLNLGQNTVTFQARNTGGPYSTSALYVLGVVTLRWPETVNPDRNSSCTTEPINTISGNQFFHETDLTIPAPGLPLSFGRTYNSRQFATNLFGVGWSHDWEWSVRVETQVVRGVTNELGIVRAGDGEEYTFRRMPNDKWLIYGRNWELTPPIYGFDGYMKTPDMEYRFGTNGLLNKVTLRGVAWLEFDYVTSSGKKVLSATRHSNGQSLTMTVNNGRIDRVTSPVTNLYVNYTYSSGNVATAARVSSQGTATWQYTYGSGVLKKRVNSLGETFDFLYASDNSRRGTNLAVNSAYYKHSVVYGPASGTVRYSRNGIVDTNTYNISTARAAVSSRSDSAGTWESYLRDMEGNVTQFWHGAAASYLEEAWYDSGHHIVKTAQGIKRLIDDWPEDYYVYPSNFTWFAWDTADYNARLVNVSNVVGRKTTFAYTHPYSTRLPTAIQEWYSGAGYYETQLSYTNRVGTNGLFAWAGLVGIRDANQHETRFDYDDLGRLSCVTPPLGPETRFSNNVLGHVEQIVQPGPEGDRITRLTRDELGRVLNVRYADTDIFETFLYDKAGHLTNSTDAASRIDRYKWLPTGKLASATRIGPGITNTVALGYDAQMNVITVTNAMNRVVERYVLDAAGRCVAVTNLEGQTQTILYSGDTQVMAVYRFDGSSVYFTYSYDFWPNLVCPGDTPIELHYPDRYIYIDYNADYSIRAVEDTTEGQTTNTYDSLGRLTNARGISAKSSVSYAHDPVGNVTQVLSVAGSSEYRFDAADRLTNIVVRLPGVAQPLAFDFTYNAVQGGMDSIRYPAGNLRADLAVDVMDRVTNLSWRSGAVPLHEMTYGYNVLGLVTNIVYGDGRRASFLYDALDRLTEETQPGAAGPWNEACLNGGTNVIRYTYDAAGNRLSKIRDDGVTVAYTYPYGSSGDRLASWSATSTNNFRPAGLLALRGTSSETIGTDPLFGTNWVSNTTAGVVMPEIAGSTWRVSGMNVGVGTQKIVVAISDMAGNVGLVTNTVQIGVYTNVKYTYNAAGCLTNMTSRGIAGVQERVDLAWDSLYRLTQVSRDGQVAESYRYDPLDRRYVITTGAETNYLVYDGPHVIAETDVTGGLRRAYTYGPGIDNLLAMTVYTGAVIQTYYYLTDLQGTVHAVANSAGAIVEHYRFDAWGRILGVFDANDHLLPVSAIGNRFLFQGREYSWSSGLYYFRARWYDPVTGRWLSNDPIGIAGGLNQYMFCSNDPLNNVDPHGKSITAIFAVGAAAILAGTGYAIYKIHQRQQRLQKVANDLELLGVEAWDATRDIAIKDQIKPFGPPTPAEGFSDILVPEAADRTVGRTVVDPTVDKITQGVDRRVEHIRKRRCQESAEPSITPLFPRPSPASRNNEPVERIFKRK